MYFVSRVSLTEYSGAGANDGLRNRLILDTDVTKFNDRV